MVAALCILPRRAPGSGVAMAARHNAAAAAAALLEIV
jgi:hypothetical protein